MNNAKRRIANADGSSYVIRSELTGGAGPNDPNLEQSHIYLNLSIVNGNTDDAFSQNPPRCIFSETRSGPILEDASKFDISVVRFLATGTGRLLPLWIPTIDPVQDVPFDVNKTVYSLTVVDNNPGSSLDLVQESLIYFPTNTKAPIPSTISPQDLSSDYYYGKTFSQFCLMFNTALNEALSKMSGTIVKNEVEQGLRYDPVSGLFSLNLTSSFYPGSSGLPQPLSGFPRCILYMNAPLYNLLANFPGILTNNSNGRTFQVSVGSAGSGAFPTSTNVGSFRQDFPSTNDVWTPIDSFCFTTTFIPLNPESSSAPIQVNDSNIGQNLATGQAFANIIHDFCPDQTKGAQNGISQLLYEPTGEYRISSMTAKQPVQAVDITMWWRFRLTGQLIPLFMPSLASVSMKIMFRRKTWHSSKD